MASQQAALGYGRSAVLASRCHTLLTDFSFIKYLEYTLSSLLDTGYEVSQTGVVPALREPTV